MRVYVSSILACSVEQAWESLQRPGHLIALSKPVIGFEEIDNFPSKWEERAPFQCRLRVFGIRHPDTHEIEFTKIDPVARLITTEERSRTLKRWSHEIKLTAHSPNQTLYEDTIEIDAGWQTLWVWGFANVLYRHRHKRWKRLLKEKKA